MTFAYGVIHLKNTIIILNFINEIYFTHLTIKEAKIELFKIFR